MLYATDSVVLADVRVDDAGYLEAFARTARTGVQQYLGAEMGRPDLSVVNVYRDASEVFSHASLHSFAKIPVTVDHPPGGVSATNWKDVAVGTTGEEVLRDGERLKIGLKIMDAAAIREIRAGKRELSVGYRTEIVWGDGTAPDGTPYQARQTQIVADHIAIVSAGRAGASCRIGDSWSVSDAGGARDPGSSSEPRNSPPIIRDTAMKTHMIGDNAVEMSDAAIVAVKGLQQTYATAVADALAKDAALTTALSDHKAAITAKDAEIANAKKASETKDGEIAALKQQLKDAELTPAKLDAAVTSRVKVITDARKIAGDTLAVDGKTENEIRREAVAVHLGDAAKSLSDEAIGGAFLSYAAKAPADPLARVLQDALPQTRQQTGTVVQMGDAATEYARMRERDANAWKMGA